MVWYGMDGGMIGREFMYGGGVSGAGFTGESAAPELCRRCFKQAPRDAQSTPVQAHNQTLDTTNDVDINISRRENIVVNNIKEWTSQCNLVVGLSKRFIIDTGMNNKR